jgi:hypothetical protein
MNEKKLPIVKTVSPEWVVAWKGAGVMLSQDMRTLVFKPMFQSMDMKYNVADEAICASISAGHIAPDDGCRCGFNAWHDPNVAYNYVRANTGQLKPTLIRVGLKGQVVEGVLHATERWTYWGYRASDQLVTDVFLEKRCTTCGAEAHFVGVSAFTQGYWRLMPVCASHHGTVAHIIHLNSIALNNDVEMRWLNPSEYMQSVS